MKKVIAKKDFSTNIGDFIKGDEIEGLTYNQIVRLNQNGFIEPLNHKDLILIKREINEKKYKEEKL